MESVVNFREILNIKFFDTIVLYFYTIGVIFYANKINE